MKTLNEINAIARKHAEQEMEKRKSRQDAEFWAAFKAGALYTAIAASAIIAVGYVYHGNLGWLL